MTTNQELLIANDEYLKSGIHIGTKFKTKYMEKFIYKTRPDGLSVLNIQQIDERIRYSINMLSQYSPQDIVVVSRRENGWKPVKLFGDLTGVRTYTGRYPPGILTNPTLDNFAEAKIILVTDPWPDKNIVMDAQKVGIPVIGLCDTNNQTNYVDLVVPCNNKGKKSLGLFFYLLTKNYMLNRGLIKSEEEFKYSINDFSDE
ncbi:MAG: 30S ribosomal protein S2 [Candidatus Woesearchaeota archaeon]